MATTSITGGENHNVTVYGNGTVVAGDGNNSVHLMGGSVTLGDGQDTVSASGNATVSAGSGNNLISVGGSGQVAVGSGNDTISLLGSGQITEVGPSGNDTIRIGSGNDTISIQGNATVYGSNISAVNPVSNRFPLIRGGADRPFPTRSFSGATIAGGGELHVGHQNGFMQDVAVSGTMTLAGGTARTDFVGGSGTTVMRGGSGQDTFIGGTGHDTMSGVGSHNVFEFLSSSQGGSHVITNFVSGDQINVDGHSFSYLLANNQVSMHDGNTYISADGGKTTIEIQGVSLGHPAIQPHIGVPITGGSHLTAGFSTMGANGSDKLQQLHSIEDMKGRPL